VSDELVAKIRALSEQLHATAYQEIMDDWIRGGLPSTSIPQGSPSAEKPLPHLEQADKKLMQALTEYNRNLDGAWRLLERNRILETSVLVEHHMNATQRAEYRQRMARAALEEVGPRAQDCANPNCRRPVERNEKDRMKGGRCLPCYEWLRTNGAERPKHLTALDVEREAVKKTKKRARAGG